MAVYESRGSPPTPPLADHHSEFVCAEWEAHADPNGPANDSRRGLGAYYRYNPRSIKKLTDDRYAEVAIPRPKIDASVFERIKAARDGYAPIVLPDRYALVYADGRLVEAGDNPYEHPTQSQSRCADQERVWNWVWFRRVLYFSTVAVTLLFLVPPMMRSEPMGPDSRALGAAIGLLGNVLPGFLQPLTDFYQKSPVLGVGLAATLFILMFTSSRVQQKIHDGMRAVWDEIVTAGRVEVVPSPGPADLVYRLRAHRAYRATAEFLSQRLFPLVFGVGVLMALIWVGLATLNRAGFALTGASGSLCVDRAGRMPEAPGRWTVALVNTEMCNSTGVTLQAGVRYRIEIALPAGGWHDGTILVDKPTGFGTLDKKPAVFLLALPIRRILTAPWFVPVVRIGSRTAEYHLLGQGAIEVTPRQTGQLFLFVNDAIGLPPFTRYFYDNNSGEPATVTVTQHSD